MPNVVTSDRFEAVLFDMDGVITDTASIHARCWKTMFDEYLEKRARRNAEPFHGFDLDTDYKLYVDGKPRYAGVRDFLASRGITLPEGTPEDPAARETVCGLGNRKNELFNEQVAATGVEAYSGSIAFLEHLRRLGLKSALVTSSHNAKSILHAAKIAEFFDACVDGEVAVEQGLEGKPAPDYFLKAAEMLSVAPDRAVVIEDALSGVEAGARGGFALVIGVARHGNGDALKAHGAHVVVHDLAELLS